MHFAQTGPQYTEHEIQDFLDSNNISYHYLDEAFLYEEVAKHIASGFMYRLVSRAYGVWPTCIRKPKYLSRSP